MVTIVKSSKEAKIEIWIIFAYSIMNLVSNHVNSFCISAICELPHIDNGAFGGNYCTEGATILEGTSCDVDCDANHFASSPSVTCVSAGNLFEAEPTCEGILLFDVHLHWYAF